jgi:hypothetical protein
MISLIVIIFICIVPQDQFYYFMFHLNNDVTNVKTKSIFLFICFNFILLFPTNSLLLGQNDSLNIANALIGIDDSLIVSDSSNIKIPPKPFFVKFKNQESNAILSAYKLSKKDIDFTDYRNTGNIMSLLPFSYLNDLGSLGTPSAPSIYGLDYGNISLNINGNSVANQWNNSIDLNRVQTEGINSINISSINRGFLLGFNSNPAAINILTGDSLKSKPISRIRYYQSSNDEGFIDAMFSARVLPKLALSFRVTNNSINENFTNTDFGSWKVNVKSIYKISDSLFTKFDYYHLKLNTPLNGGIDINSLSTNSTGEYDIYSNSNSVVYDDMRNSTTMNNIYASVYGNFIPYGHTNVSIGYSKNHDFFKNTFDTTSVRNNNDYDLINAKVQHDVSLNKLNANFIAAYEQVDFNVEGINYFDKQNNYYASLLMEYSLFNGLMKPAIFGKYSEYNLQSNVGLGTDLTIRLFNNAKLFLGYSNFGKPFSIIESQYISKDIEQNYTSMFASIEYSSKLLNTSLSYFNVESSNTPVPIFNNSDITLSTSEIIYTNTEKLNTSGFNLNTQFEMWNILATANFNYNWQSKDSYFPKETNYNLTAGLYYVDTLYNSNLELKTGFTFYLIDDPQIRIYDFQKMRSASYYIDKGTFRSFDNLSAINDKYRLDFFLAGRIQDAATFYFIYENILGNNYFIVPFYPMPEGGLRIGISWDFLD